MYTTNHKIDQILEVFYTYPRLTITDFSDRAGGNPDEALRLAQVMVINNLLTQTSSSNYQLTDLGSEVISFGGWEKYCLSGRNSSNTSAASLRYTLLIYSWREVKDLLLAAVSVVRMRVLMG